MARQILHINTDDFYASALRLRDPGLKGRPVIIAGPAPRGIVFSASYEARGEGIERGMTVSAAKRLCSSGRFFPPDWGLFRKISATIFGILEQYSPSVEAVSLDEGYLDYTGCGRVFGHVLDTGSRIRRDVLAETGLDISLGIASSKLVSHVASRSAKCAHMIDVYPGCEQRFLAPVDIGRFPIVDRKHIPLLRELGISRIGDILCFSEEIFSFCFGRWGSRLYRGAAGIDPDRVRKGKERVEEFRIEQLLQPDLVDKNTILAFIYRMSERLGEKLRGERLLAGSIGMEIRYADSVTSSGKKRLSGPTSDDRSLFDSAGALFERLFSRRVRVRAIAVSAADPDPEPLQICLFGGSCGTAEKQRRIYSVLDDLRGRFPEGIAPLFGRAVCAGGLPSSGRQGRPDRGARAEAAPGDGDPGRKDIFK
ncbi:MAG: DNA polymerase IV [Candidatus Krumholzibacteriota bacterium]|nr:DNA polymerase IV [Candidatus Krumholzibacteriota bacterium]